VPEEFSLGLTETAVAVERAGLPPNWHPFEIRSPGLTMTEHRQAVAAAWEALKRRRLAGGDKLDLDVEDTLRAWTTPEVLIIVRAFEVEAQRHVFYRAAAANGLGVFSELVDDRIVFEQLKADRLVDTVVGMLPAYGPVPLRELVAVSGTRPPERNLEEKSLITPPPRTRDRSDKDSMARFASWPLHRHGMVELSVRQGSGGLRALGNVQFTDSDGGRFLTFTEPLHGGETRLRLVPSDGSHLRSWLHESIADARS
jgi:hypothetical protein